LAADQCDDEAVGIIRMWMDAPARSEPWESVQMFKTINGDGFQARILADSNGNRKAPNSLPERVLAMSPLNLYPRESPKSPHINAMAKLEGDEGDEARKFLDLVKGSEKHMP